MPYIKHVFFDIWAGLIQSSPKIIALIIISRIQVNSEMEKLRKMCIYIIALTLFVPFLILRVLESFNCDMREIFVAIHRSADFIFIVILGFFIYKCMKKRKENS
jgi:hypothetical protein